MIHTESEKRFRKESLEKDLGKHENHWLAFRNEGMKLYTSYEGNETSIIPLLMALARSFARKPRVVASSFKFPSELPAAALEVALHGTTNDTLGW